MKRAVTFLVFLFCTQILLSQELNKTVEIANGSKMLLGPIDRDGLTQHPFDKWFNAIYENYLINEQVINNIKDTLQGYTITAFLGTWCGDSKRQVPKFYKVLDATNFNLEQLEIVALDRSPEAYKQSPNREEQGLNIHRVPTFIFYKDGEEVNRIVESPRTTFEKDIQAIIEGQYTANYMAANYLDGRIRSEGIEKLKRVENELVKKLSEFVRGSKELNTMGYVKLSAKEYDEAIFVFQLNTKIFPYNVNVFDSLGEAYFKVKDYKNALVNYQKVLDQDRNDKNALSMVRTIKDAMK